MPSRDSRKIVAAFFIIKTFCVLIGLIFDIHKTKLAYHDN